MALPDFFARVADSLRPVAEVDPETLARKLSNTNVRVELNSTDPGARDAFHLACNLAARLYPRISVSDPDHTSNSSSEFDSPANESLITRAQQAILAINPKADVTAAAAQDISQPASPEKPQAAGDELAESPTAGPLEYVLRIGGAAETPPARDTHSLVVVDATGWSIIIDPAEPTDTVTGSADRARDAEPGHPLAWLAAGAVGMAELFRSVFADELGPRGRVSAQPGRLDLLTPPRRDIAPPAGDGDPNLREDAEPVHLGDVYLIGAGAIGQAAAYALGHVNVTGVLHIVDPESVALSNLQRYLLTDSNSVDKVKVTQLREALTQPNPLTTAPTSLDVRPHQARWGDHPQHLQADQVLVALDTARDRITVAATEPRHAYNAWTQVADLGWSRHENFGTQPCLACLYYPDRARPSEHEVIGEALRQHPLRTLAYLIYNIPIGFPLPGLPALAELSPPAGSDTWLTRPLIEDLISTGIVDQAAREMWSAVTIGALYRDGICAGGLLPVGDVPGEVLVPLAHQSALAGIMLAAELLWSRSLTWARRRDTNIEHRYDVLRGLPQVVSRPRQRTPHCLCSDPEYLAVNNA